MPNRTSLFNELVDIYTCAEPAYVDARLWRFKAACSHSPIDAAGNAIVSIALAAVFVNQAAPWTLALWLVLINLLSLVRLAISIVLPRMNAVETRRAERVFSLSLALHGFMWGFAFFFFAPAESIAYRSVILVWLAGTAAWVVAAYTFVFEAVLGFIVLQITPVAVYLMFSGDPLWQLLAVACFIFIPTMGMIAIRNNALLIRGQITQLENAELVEALEREKAAVLELNRDLESDLARREIIELDLREAKERAEKLAQELEKLSSLDGLTGIANRRRFDQTLEREWNRAMRARQPLSMILCDIDYFKQYNDHYGHQAGDAGLRQLAQLLENAIRRGGDLAARYGGEEFAVLLAATELDNAVGIAETLRERLQQLGLPHEGSLVSEVLTASFGVATLIPGAGMTSEDLVRGADEALYTAKAKGRNRVVAQGSAREPRANSLDKLLH